MAGCRQEEYCSKTKMKKGQDVLITKKEWASRKEKEEWKWKKNVEEIDRKCYNIEEGKEWKLKG